jgi:hypothetical protein
MGRHGLSTEGRQRDVTGHGKGMPFDFITRSMNASAFWSRGARGTGIRIAVFDTGISQRQDFVSHLVEVVDFTTEGTTADGVGHASFMAGTIASNKTPPKQANATPIPSPPIPASPPHTPQQFADPPPFRPATPQFLSRHGEDNCVE